MTSQIILLYSYFLWWCEITKCLLDELKCGEWNNIRLFLAFWWCVRKSIICLGWSWIQSHDNIHVWMSGEDSVDAGDPEKDKEKRHKSSLLKEEWCTVYNLWIVFFWNSTFNSFIACLTTSKLHHGKRNHRQGGTTVFWICCPLFFTKWSAQLQPSLWWQIAIFFHKLG